MLQRISKSLPVHPLLCHPLTGEPLTAVGVRRNGDPVWPILGGAPDDEGGDGDGGDPGDDSGDDDAGDGDDGQDGDGSEQLGDAGKKALDRMKAKLKAERQRRIAAEKDRDAKKAGEPDADQIRRDAETAATQRVNERIVRAEVKAAAGGKLADPADAVRLLDLSQFEVDDDGNVDEDDIADAIKELIEKKPYLAAQGGTGTDGKRALKPDKGQGARGAGSKPTVAAGAARYAERHNKKT